MRNAVIYARFSSSSQTEQSIEGQLRVCTRYAEEHNFNIINTYIDRAKTGRNDKRPNFQQMLKDSESHEFEYVIVYALDRFSRDNADYSIDKKKLQKNGVLLLSATEIMSNNPDGSKNLGGILTEGVLVAVAEYYSQELSKKVKRGLQESFEKNNAFGGKRIYGYRVENKKILINEDESFVVKHIFNEYAKGTQIKDILNYLEMNNIKYANGDSFTHRKIVTMLKNRKYIGEFTYNGVVKSDYFPQIIDNDLFNKVQDVIEIKVHAPKLNTSPYYLLSCKVFCRKCGRMLVGESAQGKTKKYYYYICQGKDIKRLHNDYLEDLVYYCTTKYVFTGENKKIIINEFKEEIKKLKQSSELSRLKRDLKKVDTSLSNLVKTLESAYFESIIDRIRELEKEKDILVKKIDQLNKLNGLPEDMKAIENWFDLLPISNDPEIREFVLKTYVTKVIIDDEYIEIIYVNHHLEKVTLDGKKFGFGTFGGEYVLKSELCCIILTIKKGNICLKK